MRIFSGQVFDDIISGTGPWYSSAELNTVIGAAEFLIIQACTSDVSGSAPGLIVTSR